MSDHLRHLRDLESPGPDLDAILARAGRIRSRRRLSVLGFGAASMAVLAVVAFTVSASDDRRDATDFSTLTEPRGVTPEPVVGTTGGNAVGDSVNTPGLPAEGGNSSEVAASRPPQQAPALSVSAQMSATVRQSEPFDVAVEVCNSTRQAHKAEFRSGQRIDLVARRDGVEVWRWSHDKAFGQAIGWESFSPGACKKWTATADAGVLSPGSYSVHAEFVTDPVVVSPPVVVRCESS